MAAAVVHHDGCTSGRSIAGRFASTPGPSVELLDLGTDGHRARETGALGVKRLPSLVVGGNVIRLQDHSTFQHVP